MQSKSLSVGDDDLALQIAELARKRPDAVQAPSSCPYHTKCGDEHMQSRALWWHKD